MSNGTQTIGSDRLASSGGPRLVLHGFLFLATVSCTLLAGTELAGPGASAAGILKAAASYSAALMAARFHRVDASLPFFIPLPFSPLGTLGAFIRVRSALPTRRAILDIGASGPLAGFLVAAPLLVFGYAHSQAVTISADLGVASVQSPFALVQALLERRPIISSSPTVMVMGDSVITWIAARLAHGQLPEGFDLQVGPVAFAGWIGMFVTCLNLIPIGQLDGGHVTFALFGKRARRVGQVACWALLGLGLFASWSWLVWWALSRFLIGTGHPAPLLDDALAPARRRVGWISLVVLLLTFVPQPIKMVAVAGP
jgi:membrane-associated protease RseP (regulator of RpoE activity)